MSSYRHVKLIASPQGEENIGMAMTFTLVSHLREQLFELVKSRLERQQKEESEKERLALEVRLTDSFYGSNNQSNPWLFRRKKREQKGLR